MTTTKKIVCHVLLVLLSALFIFSGIAKLMAQPAAIQSFAAAGLPIWFMYVIGLGEVLGAIGLWIRPAFRYAYEGLGLVLIGAFGTTWAFVGFGLALFPLATGIALAVIVWLHGKHAAVSSAS